MLLIGNIGLAQVSDTLAPRLTAALERVGANAVAVHVNPLQEAMQADGDTDFAGSLERLGRLADELDYPVLVKEVRARARRSCRAATTRPADRRGRRGRGRRHVVGPGRTGGPLRRGAQPCAGRLGIPTAQALIEVRRELPGYRW